MSLRRPVALAATALSAALSAGLVAGCGGSAGAGGAVQPAAAASLHGAVPDPAPAKPHFTLPDTSGAPYAFAARTAGKVTLLFWGYTHCADTCPATMHDIALALRRIPAADRAKVAVVFVTADPSRDTGPVVRRWLDKLGGSSFVGLTGTAKQIAAAEDVAGVPQAVREVGQTGSHGGDYAVDHFAGTTAYGLDDKVAVIYPTGAVVGDFAADLPVLTREEPTR